MTIDKLFDGSDAHLLPGNAELIQRLNEPELHYPGNFDTVKRANAILMCLCQEAADALEAADKRIAKLEAEVKHYMNAFDLAYNQAMKNGQAANEAERKLDVAREALKETTDVLEILRRGHGVDVGSKCYPAINIAREALAQIGGDDEQT